MSPTLLAMGVSESVAAGAIRISIGHSTTDAELAAAGQAIRSAVASIRRLAQAWFAAGSDRITAVWRTPRSAGAARESQSAPGQTALGQTALGSITLGQMTPTQTPRKSNQQGVPRRLGIVRSTAWGGDEVRPGSVRFAATLR